MLFIAIAVKKVLEKTLNQVLTRNLRIPAPNEFEDLDLSPAGLQTAYRSSEVWANGGNSSWLDSWWYVPMRAQSTLLKLHKSIWLLKSPRDQSINYLYFYEFKDYQITSELVLKVWFLLKMASWQPIRLQDDPRGPGWRDQGLGDGPPVWWEEQQNIGCW